ncbi:MAG TPA: hypothetical protein VH478_05560 [Trebonia sp.]|jgi:hypothetical protein|nr:hypothetical protein [Trebonia sp.]
MQTPHGILAGQLPTRPVRTDEDVLARVAEVLGPEARLVPALWLFFLDPAGVQSSLIMPIDDIPQYPDEEDGESLFAMLSRIFGPGGPDYSVVITLGRDGPAALTGSDRCWLELLQRGIEEYAIPARMLCLAAPGGVRELGPVAPANEVPPPAAERPDSPLAVRPPVGGQGRLLLLSDNAKSRPPLRSRRRAAPSGRRGKPRNMPEMPGSARAMATAAHVCLAFPGLWSRKSQTYEERSPLLAVISGRCRARAGRPGRRGRR